MKRTIILMLVTVLLISSINVYGAGINVSMGSVSGIKVTKNSATYDGNNLNLDFDVTNNSAGEDNYYVFLDVTDNNGNLLASSRIYRELKNGAVVPLEMSATRIFADTVNVAVQIKKDIVNTYYASPTGDDANDGRTPEKAIKTISKIPQLLTSLNSDPLYAGQDIEIVLQEGTYNIDSTVAFGEYSSLGDIKITGENAVIAGGKNFKGSDFTLVTDSDKLAMFPESVRGNIYALDLKSRGIDVSSTFKAPYSSSNDPMYTTVYYGDKNLQIAKYPNEGYLNADTFTATGKSSASFTSSQIKDTWKNLQEAWVRGWFAYDWDLEMGRISFEGTTAKFLYWHHGMSSSDISTENKPWYIYNLPEELDQENEYVFYNNVLYIYPDGEEIADGSFFDKTISINTSKTNVLEFTNTDNLTLENIDFANTRGVFAKVTADNFEIKNCNFSNGYNAINIIGDNNKVDGCDFYNLDSVAVTISGGDRATLTKANSVVENCTFHHLAQINRTGVGGVSMGGCGVVVRKNTFYDIPHSAISLGGNENLVENNDFSNILTDGSTDAGIIYSGRNITFQGNVVKANYFHDTNSSQAAVYLDDFLSGYTITGNVFDSIGNGNGIPIFIHAGVCNTFSDNIVVNAKIGVRIRGKGTKEDGYITEWNYQKAIDAGKTPYSFVNHLEDVPWQSELWQSKYGNVLKYVDNKTTRVAQDNSSTNNIFVNVAKQVYSYDGGQADSHLNQSGNQTLTSVDANLQAKIDAIKNLCGATK